MCFIQFGLAVLFTVATFLDLQTLISIASLQIQIKTCLALAALLHLRRKNPDLPRTIKVVDI